MPKRTGQITRIKNGTWQARIQWVNRNKVRQSQSERFASRELASEGLKTMLKDLEIAESLPAPVQNTFDQLFDAYLEIIRPTVREQTYYLYERLIKTYLRKEFGERQVISLTVLEIERFYVDLQKRLAAETIFKIHTQFKRALKKARNWKWISENPIDDVRPPKRVKKSKEVLTNDELNAFFAACPTLSVKAQWIFFALTGARTQEVFAARWSDVDFERKTFTVRQVLVQTKQVKKFDVPKTENSNRAIPLSDALLVILKKHKVEQNILRLKCEGWQDLDLIFPTGTGKPQRLSNIGEKVAKIRTAAGINKNVTPHLFRHSFVSDAVRSGGDIKAISEIVGHSTVNFTLNVYRHTQFSEKQSVINEVSDRILKAK